MNKTRIVLGIGIVLAILAVFTVSASAQNIVYFDPDPSCAAPGETIYVELRLNSTEGVTSMETDIYFDPNVLNITDATPGAFPNQFGFEHHGNYAATGGATPDWENLPPGDYLFANLTIEARNAGTSALTYDRNHLWDVDFNEILDVVWIEGTFNCPCPTTETFTKELVSGWNLISLPLYNATDMTVANIIDTSLCGSYDALYRYDVSSHSFVSLSSSDTMENGVGYFIHMTSADTWTYTGSSTYTNMSTSLPPGLNLVGWLNCSTSISDALSSIADNYNYVARWNASSQEFEVYVPGAPAPFNDFELMEPGTGYFISAKSATTLTESCGT